MNAMRKIETSVVHMLAAAAVECPDRQAVRFGTISLTYAQYFKCVAALADRLRRLGVKPGDRVVTIMANSTDAAIATFGVQASGAQLVPLNPSYTSAELETIITDANPTIVLCDQEIAPTLDGVAVSCGSKIYIAPGELAAYKDAVVARDRVLLPEPDWLSTLQYTGGTQGLPKGVNLTHRAVATNIGQREALVSTRDGEQVMCITPLFHVYAVSMGLYLAARCRGTLHIIRKFDAGEIFSQIARDRISFLSASPTILLGLMKHEGFSTTDFSSLRICSSGSAPLSEDTLRTWEEATGCRVCEGYGQTEAGPVLTYNPSEGLRKTGTVGVIVPGTRVSIVDVETGMIELPVGEVGEVRASGPQIMLGYRNRPEETAEALRKGWLYTGDLGRLDGDGYLTICGRKKEMIITAGYNVYPREIEEALQLHQGVHETAVFGVHDAYRGEMLVAYVIRSDLSLTSENLMAHLGQRLTKYKWPREIRFVDVLPKTAVGKVDKKVLREGWAPVHAAV